MFSSITYFEAIICGTMCKSLESQEKKIFCHEEDYLLDSTFFVQLYHINKYNYNSSKILKKISTHQQTLMIAKPI